MEEGRAYSPQQQNKIKGGCKVKKTNEKQLIRINEYFEEAGVSFDDVEILVTDSKEELMEYLMNTDSELLIDMMSKINELQIGDDILTTILSEISYVWLDYDNSDYFVIIQ